MALGDVISQTFVEKKNLKDLNVYRTVKFGSLGLFLVGPGLGVWYKILDRYVVFSKPTYRALGKMAVDQVIFAPIFLYNFLWINGLTSFKSVDEVKKEVKKTYFPILVTNYKVWPAVQLLNFGLVPPNLRIAFVQTVAIFWNTYLSWMTNK